MSSYGQEPQSPTLAVRLMSVAAEFELQVRRERQRWEDKVADLKAANADLEQQNWQQASQLETLSRKLEAAIAEMQKYSDSHVRARGLFGGDDTPYMPVQWLCGGVGGQLWPRRAEVRAAVVGQLSD